MTELERMSELVEVINKHSYNYYVLDNPTISDKEWDKLYNELLELEEKTGVVLSDSPSQKVGGEVLAKFKKHTHLTPLYSLNKCQSLDELKSYYNKIATEEGTQEYTLEYKFDGLTVTLTYENGIFVSAATRGNGIVGEDVTNQVKTINCVPLSIPYKNKVVVQGEALMPLKSLIEYNKTAVEPLKNARNGVAGAIRNLDPNETKKRNLIIYFYAVPFIEGKEFSSQVETMQFLQDNKFLVNDFYKVLSSFEDIKNEIEKVDKIKQDLPFLIDGMVLKINNISVQKRLGHTIKFPRFAMAFKFEALEVSTMLNNVVWQVGRTGKITPIAELEPVELSGATITRATLNNMNDIVRKKLKIGSRVFIRRSNEVIPEVLGLSEEYASSTEILPPSYCPSCQSELTQVGANLFCLNSNHCKSQIIQRVVHYCSRDAMNIEGVSEQTALQFYDNLNLRTVADIYNLTKDQLLTLEKFKDKKADNILNAIKNSKQVSLSKFIYSLGILNVGKKTALDLAKTFGTLENLINAKSEDLICIKDIGEIVTESILQFFSTSQNLEIIDLLLSSGVKVQNDEQNINKTGKFANKNCVLTGTLQKYSRTEASELIAKLGGNVLGSVSKNVDFVICGENAGSKLVKAQNLGVRVLTEEEFYDMLKD